MNKRRTFQSFITAFAVVVIGMPIAGNAAAPSQIEDVTVKVSYSDLNIESIEGAKVLYSRLQRATRQACNVQSLKVVGSVRNHVKTMQCYQDALDSAVQRVDSAAPISRKGKLNTPPRPRQAIVAMKTA